MAKWVIQTVVATGKEILKKEDWTYHKTVVVSSAARDHGSGGRETAIRKGRCLGLITATSLTAQYASGAGDGTETMTGVLAEDIDLLDDSATAVNTSALMLVVGIVDNAQLNGIDGAGRTDMGDTTAGKLMVFDNV